jgi:hypothetical protein
MHHFFGFKLGIFFGQLQKLISQILEDTEGNKSSLKVLMLLYA